MKRILYVLILSASVSLSLMAQEKPVVALFPMQNPTGETWIDSLGNTVEEVVFLTLSLMGQYEIVKPEELSAELSEEGLSELARREGYDDIICGECALTDEGYRFSVSNYDLYKEETTVRAEENFESLLDSFDAADRLSEALIEGLSGVKVRYGGLTLALFRDEPYRTVIDDVDVGEGFTGSDKFLVGPHTLRFFQDRGEGDILVSERKVEISEGDSLTLNSPIPWLTAELAAELRELERRIAEEGDKFKRSDLTEGLFVEARSRVGGEYYDLYRPELLQRYADWEALYKEAPVDLAGHKHSSDFLTSMYLGYLPYNSLFAAPRELAGSNLSEGAALLERLRSSSVPIDGNNTVLPDTADIKVDGFADDWKNVSTVFQDEQGTLLEEPYLKEHNELFEGQDIEWVGVAMDEKRIYVAIKTVGSAYSSRRQYNVDFSSGDLFRVGYYRKDKLFSTLKVRGRNWDKALWTNADNSPMKGAARDIIEMSIPWSELYGFMTPENWTFDLEFVIERITDPWKRVDTHYFKVFIPEFYYALRASD